MSHPVSTCSYCCDYLCSYFFFACLNWLHSSYNPTHLSPSCWLDYYWLGHSWDCCRQNLHRRPSSDSHTAASANCWFWNSNGRPCLKLQLNVFEHSIISFVCWQFVDWIAVVCRGTHLTNYLAASCSAAATNWRCICTRASSLGAPKYCLSVDSILTILDNTTFNICYRRKIELDDPWTDRAGGSRSNWTNLLAKRHQG